MPGAPRRHHYLPQFYLRGFANRKGRVRVYRREEGEQVVTHVRNAAVETGFYDFVDQDGHVSLLAEAALAEIETDASEAMQHLVSGLQRSPTNTRQSLSRFMAIQMMRTPEKRDFQRAMSGSLREMMRVDEGMTEEAIDALFDRSGITAPNQNDDIRLMFSIAESLEPLLSSRDWLLGKSREGGLVTSDTPVVAHAFHPDPLRGVGIANADQIFFPVDRQHVLILVPPGLGLPAAIWLNPDDILFVNSLMTLHSYRYVFQDPRDTPLGDLMPRNPRPLAQANGRDIYRAS